MPLLRLIPPAGTRMPLSRLAAMFTTRFRKDVGEQFKSDIKNITGCSHCFLMNSGTTANFLIFKALASITDKNRNEVILPAYTCFTVAASIVRAGLKIRLIDIDPHTLDYDFGELNKTDMGNVLAILGSNLFGILSNWTKLKTVAKQNGVFLIDDAAQSMGISTLEGNSGNFGDVGIFSLNRGKNLPTYSGGIIVTDNPRIAEFVKNEIEKIDEPGHSSELLVISKILLSGILLRPRLYWAPAALPFLGLGETIYDEDFKIGRLTRSQKALGHLLIPDLKKLNISRAAKANQIAKHLRESNKYFVPGYGSDYPVAYIRLPVLANSKEEREEAIKSLRKIGIVSSSMYPSTIGKIDGIEQHLTTNENIFPGAETVVDRLFTLPTHGYVTISDIERIITCLI